MTQAFRIIFYLGIPGGCLKRRHVYEAARPRSHSAEIIELLYKYNKNIIILKILLLVAKFQGNIRGQVGGLFLRV